MAKLIAALANLRVLAEHAVHRPHRTDVTAFVQERREHFGRRQVDQSRLVQRVEQSLTLGVAEPARRRSSPGLRAVDRRAMPVVGRAVDAQCGASRDDAEIRCKTEGGGHSLSSSIGGRAIPSTCESFFWTSMIASARCTRRVSLAIRRCCSASCLSRASTTFGSGPRFFGVRPAISPRSACSRHFIKCDEYRPSRRSNAPSSPRCVQAAAACRTRLFSSALNLRLFAFAVTSVAGLPAGKDTTLIVGHASLALRGCVTNLRGGDCLRHVGTEGGAIRSTSASACALTKASQTVLCVAPCRCPP